MHDNTNNLRAADYEVRWIKRNDERWHTLLTYADERLEHSGAIYRATNWTYVGRTSAYLNSAGQHVSKKCGPKTRSHTQLLEAGFTSPGRFAKHKFVLYIRD